MKKKHLILLRIILAILIALNLAAIFGFSGESAVKSTETSSTVTQKVAAVVVPDFENKPVEEQQVIVKKMEPPIRKAAHFLEYASLGALVFLFLLTWKGIVLLQFSGSVVFSAIYAVTDELHQKFSFGRAASIKDVLIDTAGALFACLVVLLIRLAIIRIRKKPKKIGTTVYSFSSAKLSRPVRLAVAADLHGNFYPSLPDLLRGAAPDAILIPGDLAGYEAILEGDAAIYDFLKSCASIAPTF